MLRINKASEYGVLALKYIGNKDEALSAREIADGLHIPYEITAKTLQKLKEAGFIGSSMGTNGGYKLLNPLSQISIAQVIAALEGPLAIVECMHDTTDCSRMGSCEIRDPMRTLNERIKKVLESTTLVELAGVEDKIS